MITLALAKPKKDRCGPLSTSRSTLLKAAFLQTMRMLNLANDSDKQTTHNHTSLMSHLTNRIDRATATIYIC